MVRHHTRRKQFVTLIVEVQGCIQDQAAGCRGKMGVLFGRDRDRVDGPRPFKMRKATHAVPRSARIRPASHRTRRRATVASTRDACATRKQRERILGAGTGAQGNGYAQRLQPAAQDDVVLLSENLRRRHQRRLEARFNRQQHRGHGHDRFARANIALQQSIHRPGRPEISAQFLDHSRLRIR